MPFIETYPFLIPKTYTEPFKYNHDWFLPELYECETQVNHFNVIKHKVYKIITIYNKN